MKIPNNVKIKLALRTAKKANRILREDFKSFFRIRGVKISRETLIEYICFEERPKKNKGKIILYMTMTPKRIKRKIAKIDLEIDAARNILKKGVSGNEH